MRRDQLVAKLDRPDNDPWDIVVIGGGAVGFGVALDAITRGHSCLLLEQHDFCKGTSSRSTKLIHGGVRYLAQGNVSLVREALYERGLLLRNAPDVVKPLRFIVPCYSAMERWYYWAGMKCYDGLAGRLGISPSRQLSTGKVASAIPGLRKDRLRGGVAYFDAQFDDSRLVIAVAQKFCEMGGVSLNYMPVDHLLLANNRVSGVAAIDLETSRAFEIPARCVVNATGAFSDSIRKMESADAPAMISPSQGIHLVVDQKFLGGDDALMIPKTKDGRVLFAIPWLGRAVLGTTDTPVARPSLEPSPLAEEVSYLLEHFAFYLDPAPTHGDVLSIYSGLRPLVKPKQEAGATSKISREHRVVQSAGGLISILGGKWTTFRKMGEDVVDVAEEVGGLEQRKPKTKFLPLDVGSGAPSSQLSGPNRDEVLLAIRNGFARTVEDVLARRHRNLLLDARHSITLAEDVARTMAAELGKDEAWIAEQVSDYRALAAGYLPK